MRYREKASPRPRSARPAMPLEGSLTLILLLLRFIIFLAHIAAASSSPESAPPPSPQQAPPPPAVPPPPPSSARPGGRVTASIRPDSTGSLSPRTVTTRYGELRGVVWAPDGRHSGAVEAFLGVPYASPPTGSLRFMPPVSGAVWRGVRLADRPGPACPQRFPEDVAAVSRSMEAAPNPPSAADEEIIRKMPKGRVEGLKRLLPHLRRQSEDCLFLNIYTPVPLTRLDGSSSGATLRLPVIVFIHGESFEWNSGNPYDGSLLAAHGGLVVVTINFRLGVLGFLNANSDAGHFRSPANYGLMDQIAALHWIQENIAAFGGDPGSVTILGHGTGAACANFLMVSPAIPDGMLFHRVILMSGSALSPWALVKDPWRHALAVARHVNCTSTPAQGVQLQQDDFGMGDDAGQEEDDGSASVADERLQRLLPPSPRLLRCLREKPLSELTSAPIPTTPFAASAFGPSVDGVVVDADAAGGLLPPPRSNSFGGGTSGGGFSGPGSSASSSGGSGPGSSLSSGSGVLDGTGSGSFDADANGASAAAEAERRRRRKKYVDRLARYDLLFGVVRAEAYFAFTAEDLQYGIETDRRSRLLRTFVRNTYRYHLSEILATVVNEYTDWERPVQHPVNIRDETLEALSDATVVAPLVQTGDYHASAAAATLAPPDQSPPAADPPPAPAPVSAGSSSRAKSTYFYVFEYQTKNGDYPQRQGCVHGEELPYVFGAPLAPLTATPFPKNFTKAESQLSEATIIYWSNFARTGNPNEPQEADVARGVRQERNRFRNIDWAAYEGMHKKYLNLDTKPRLKNHYRAHRLSFWLNLVPDLHRPGGDGVPATHHLLPSDVAAFDGQPSLLPPQPPRLGIPGTHAPFNLTALLVPPRGPWEEEGSEGQIGESEAEAVASAAASGHGPLTNRTHSPSGPAPAEAAAAGSEADDGFAAYSTALSVTIAIGCSLLILNVLIFAGVYYQRDKHRLEAKKRTENGRMPNISGEVGDSASSSGGLPSAKASPQTAAGTGRTQLPPPEFADLPHHHHHHHHPAMAGAGLVAVAVPVPPPPKVSSASPGAQSQLPQKAGTASNETGVNKTPRSECQPLLPQGIQLLPQTFRTSPIVPSGTATVKKVHQRQVGKVGSNAEELRV